jgi:aconitate hydratase/homoaconitate hydratase
MDRDRFARLIASRHDLPTVIYQTPQAENAEIAAKKNGRAQTNAASHISGRAQLFGDHIDTDAMIAGEFCHLSDHKEIGQKAFYHFRPDFVSRVENGENLVVAGEGWGSGSSREHAVWALQGAGVRAVIAKSFAYIHKRNLVNEALPFLIVRDEAFYREVQDGDPLHVDLEAGTVTLRGKTYSGQPLPAVMTGIMQHGGLVPDVKEALDAK